MNDPQNPYAVTGDGEQLAQPIFFGGTLTRDDLMMSLSEAPPKKGFARLHYPLMLLAAIVGAILLVKVTLVDGQEPLPSFLWTLLAFALLPGWIAAIRFVSPAHRRRVSRLEVMATNQTYTAGWFDDQHFVISDRHSVFRGQWSFFGAAFLFPSHVVLPTTTNANHRVVLPNRFFASAADLQQAVQFLRLKLTAVINQPANDKQLATTSFDEDPGRRIDVETVRNYTRERWPFASDPSRQSEYTIDLRGNVSSFWMAVKAASAILLVMTWYFLPMWLAVIAWLLSDFWFFGNWNFIHERIISTGLILGPAAFILVFFLYSAVRTAIQIRHTQAQPLDICLRDTGLHLSHATFDSWAEWENIIELIAEPNVTGWIVRESTDEIRFPDACFENRQSFETFQQTLQSLYKPIVYPVD